MHIFFVYLLSSNTADEQSEVEHIKKSHLPIVTMVNEKIVLLLDLKLKKFLIIIKLLSDSLRIVFMESK